MATKYVTISNSWKEVNSGACVCQKRTKKDILVYVGSSEPDDNSPYGVWRYGNFAYNGSDKLYAKTRSGDVTLVVFT